MSLLPTVYEHGGQSIISIRRLRNYPAAALFSARAFAHLVRWKQCTTVVICGGVAYARTPEWAFIDTANRFEQHMRKYTKGPIQPAMVPSVAIQLHTCNTSAGHLRWQSPHVHCCAACTLQRPGWSSALHACAATVARQYHYRRINFPSSLTGQPLCMVLSFSSCHYFIKAGTDTAPSVRKRRRDVDVVIPLLGRYNPTATETLDARLAANRVRDCTTKQRAVCQHH